MLPSGSPVQPFTLRLHQCVELLRNLYSLLCRTIRQFRSVLDNDSLGASLYCIIYYIGCSCFSICRQRFLVDHCIAIFAPLALCRLARMRVANVYMFAGCRIACGNVHLLFIGRLDCTAIRACQHINVGVRPLARERNTIRTFIHFDPVSFTFCIGPSTR